MALRFSATNMALEKFFNSPNGKRFKVTCSSAHTWYENPTENMITQIKWITRFTTCPAANIAGTCEGRTVVGGLSETRYKVKTRGVVRVLIGVNEEVV